MKTYDGFHVGGIAVAVIAALVAGEGLTLVVQKAGGYRVLPHGLGEYLPKREVLPGIFQSARGLFAYLPDLYRCVPPAAVTAKSLTLWIICLIGPAFVLVRLCPAARSRSAAGRTILRGRPTS